MRHWSITSKQRTRLFNKCGRKCFLGTGKKSKSYPICSKTCKLNRYGIHAAYVRARQYKNTRIANKAKRLLK